MANLELCEIIRELNLQPLWYGDFLVEIYKSDKHIPEEIFGGDLLGGRELYSQAYYLLPEKVICPLHKMSADESWQYCLGGPLELFIIRSNGQLDIHVIGNDILDGQKLMHIVPAGEWFAARCKKGSKYSLISHFVAPAFEDSDWEKGYFNDLCSKYPQHTDFLQTFCWPVK